MRLTNTKVKNAKPEVSSGQTKLSDGGGLFLLVKANKKKVGKYWRLAYRFGGKQKDLALGTYPLVTLKEARDKRDEAKKLLAQHIDPSQKKQDDRLAAVEKLNEKKRESELDANTFEVVGRKWFNHNKPRWEDSHSRTVISRLEKYVFPKVGNLPIRKVTKIQLTDLIEAIVDSGRLDTARKVTQYTRNTLEFASDRGLLDSIPLGQTKNLVPAIQKIPLPALTEPKAIGELLTTIDAYKKGSFVTCCALKLLPYLAVRSGEFRKAEWTEFDFEAALWTIPALHRKLKKEFKADPTRFHLVPLSKQSIVILKRLKKLTGQGLHVFPSIRGDGRPMSENTINYALERMGYKGEMVGHGFRTIFSTLLNEQGYNPDAIERQLAHQEPNQVRAAYNRAKYIDIRTEMLQDWADYLDELRAKT